VSNDAGAAELQLQLPAVAIDTTVTDSVVAGSVAGDVAGDIAVAVAIADWLCC